MYPTIRLIALIIHTLYLVVSIMNTYSNDVKQSSGPKRLGTEGERRGRRWDHVPRSQSSDRRGSTPAGTASFEDPLKPHCTES